LVAVLAGLAVAQLAAMADQVVVVVEISYMQVVLVQQIKVMPAALQELLILRTLPQVVVVVQVVQV
jgi:hypothetical protein